MMLYDFPVQFDGESIPEPEEWSEESAVIEVVNQTEAGTDQIAVTRYDKMTVGCAFNCSSRWAAKFKRFSKRDQITVNMYDIESNGYLGRTMRIREFKADPLKESYRTRRTNGLWKITFNLEEF